MSITSTEPTTQPSATGLKLEVAHSVLYVHDADKMIGFYTDMLGFEVTDRGPILDQEIIFMSQIATHHHQVAFITGRGAPEKSNSTHHTAYRSSGSLDDLKALLGRLQAHPEVTGIMPLTHGNAWSIYFQDPENNGVEIFIDTPWHVKQPQGKPLDLTRSNDEIIAATEAAFANEPEFSDLGAFYQRRAQHLDERS